MVWLASASPVLPEMACFLGNARSLALQSHPLRVAPSQHRRSLVRFPVPLFIARLASDQRKSNQEASLDLQPPRLSPLLDSDPDLLLATFESQKSERKITVLPRMCTLRAFGRSGEGVVKANPETVSAFLKSLAASVEISAKIRDWEILSGRLAMILFVVAVLLESFTGKTVFHKIDAKRLSEIIGVCLMAIFGAAGFAFASKAKVRVADSMSRLVSKGCENLVNSWIDNIIDGLFFDDE